MDLLWLFLKPVLEALSASLGEAKGGMEII
jgi:hypothetical protein